EDSQAILATAGFLTADGEAIWRRVFMGLASPTAAPASAAPEDVDIADVSADLAEDAQAGQRGDTIRQQSRRLTGEILALRGRLTKESALQNGNDASLMLRAVEHYLGAEAWGEGRDMFPVVNAATLLLAAGKTEQARDLATRIIAKADGTDYWSLASLAEANLIAGKAEAAHAAIRAAMLSPYTDDMVAATRRQIRRFAHSFGAAANAVLAQL